MLMPKNTPKDPKTPKCTRTAPVAGGGDDEMPPAAAAAAVTVNISQEIENLIGSMERVNMRSDQPNECPALWLFVGYEKRSLSLGYHG